MNGRPGYSVWELEAYLAGDLSKERREAIEHAAREDQQLKAWIEERKAERDAFHFDARRRPFAQLVEEAGATPTKRSRLPFISSLSLAGAVALGVVFFVAPTDGIRTKGDLGPPNVTAALLLGPKETSQIFDGSQKLHPGDRLRLTVEDRAGGYVTVLLQEENGRVDLLYKPQELGRLLPGTHRLPGSLQLDKTLGRERIYVLVSIELPDVSIWITELQAEHQKAGFKHDWLPEGNARVATLEYEKVR